MKRIFKQIVGRFVYKFFICLDDKQLAYISKLISGASNDVYKSTRLALYNLHPSVSFGDRTLVYGNGDIEIGEGTYFGRDCYVQSEKPGKIKIGKYCAIAHNIHIRTSDFKKKYNFKDALNDSNEIKDIVIGDYVWIGANSYICSGIIIGDNVIIGANSVVTKDIPANSVAGGVPARVLFGKEKYLIATS